MMTMDPKKGNYVNNRRQGPDFWVKFLQTASVLVWGFMLITLLIIEQAKPELENFFSHMFNVTLRQRWDLDLLTYAFYLSVFMCIFSIFSLIVNKKRHRRKTDRYSKSIIFTLIFSLWIIFFYFSITW